MQWKGYPKESDWTEKPLGHCNEIDVLRDFRKDNSRDQVDDVFRNL
jgi:hypothetical protein